VSTPETSQITVVFTFSCTDIFHADIFPLESVFIAKKFSEGSAFVFVIVFMQSEKLKLVGVTVPIKFGGIG
jgi:hypothetical protein